MRRPQQIKAQSADKKPKDVWKLDEKNFPPLGSDEYVPASNVEDRRSIHTSSSSNCHSMDHIRTGVFIEEFHEDLNQILMEYLAKEAHYLVAPIQSPDGLRVVVDPDIVSNCVIPYEDRLKHIILNLGAPPFDTFIPERELHFKNLIGQVDYLKCRAMIIDCPSTEIGQLALANIINNYGKKNCGLKTDPLVLIRCLVQDDEINESKIFEKINGLPASSPTPSEDTDRPSSIKMEGIKVDSPSKNWLHNAGEDDVYTPSCYRHSVSWDKWNSFRTHLQPYGRLGVCLDINDAIDGDPEELARWSGEPVRLIIIHTNQFIKSANNQPRLSGPYKEFIRTLMLKNSMKPDIIIRGHKGEELKEYLDFINEFTCGLISMNLDPLRPWNDRMQIPMQPLATNLSSGTYSVFESDAMKYMKYKDAMELALQHLISTKGSNRNQFYLMVLGAGRGPLVNCFIECLKSMSHEIPGKKFKIFALDKNHSACTVLKYKQRKEWSGYSNLFVTEIVMADMRSWNPEVKADIIATELLGSLADNELSPECLDGVWRFSTPDTISIPKKYASYIQPISSFKCLQELQKSLYDSPHDRIWVSRLNNFHAMCEPQKLFEFEHNDLSLHPSMRHNERYTELKFYSKVNTVCHGFAGYFSAQLFDRVSISTVPGEKTTNMNSWFPVYIPIDQPIQVPRGSLLVVHFWRKESVNHVWYEWALTHPIKTRIFSAGGNHTRMSKFCENDQF